ncbi:hypothetical protein A2635_05320 [Candidatus Peribacteria bacterium RIFCSPHIGHO2_01_FULL_51_9]|nr:MAG: hypothetical protein A2635_05320 [Candidatus Peribacteria bacterium RIFCSPHIGHO2_01_FULL_51_9]
MMLHHFILPKKKGFDVDHINRNIFDNRRENLRYVTHSQNMMNMKKSAINTSGFRGVTWNKRRKKWVAQIGFQMEKIYLGAFNDIEAAARAYKTAALKYFEEYLGET